MRTPILSIPARAYGISARPPAPSSATESRITIMPTSSGSTTVRITTRFHGSRLLVLLCCAFLTTALPSSVEADESLRRTPVVRAVEKVSPAVVNIYTETLVHERSPFPSPFFGDPLFEGIFPELFGRVPQGRTQRRRSALGSGVIVDDKGMVITNEHVIVRGSSIHVLTSDNREFPAVLLGSDSDSDLAVLRIESDTPLHLTRAFLFKNNVHT